MSGHCQHNLCALALILSLMGYVPHAMATCTAGSLDLELVSATGTGATTHPFAKCFSSMTVNVLGDCTLSLFANGQNNFVQGLWSAAPTYEQLIACPTGASQEYDSDATATATAALQSLIASSIYSEGMDVSSVVAESGAITIISTVLGNAATLKFRSSGTTGTAIGFFTTVGAPSCATATECASAATGCEGGRYPVGIDGTITYACALCASGSYSGAGETACTKAAAGSAIAAVGSTSDTSSPCAAGTFATSGSSDCRPCAPGMYQDGTSQSSCKACPTSWSSHTYGAIQCVKCTNGRPAVCSADCSDSTAGSDGSFTATVSGSTLASGSFADGYIYPSLLNPCSPDSATVSFAVDATCQIEIRAMAQTTDVGGLMCSDPSNTATGVTAYYIAATVIMSRLGADDVTGNIVKIINKSATDVTMTVIAASSAPGSSIETVSADLTVNGGDLAGASAATCPAGTLTVGAGSTLSCPACDPGSSCAAQAASAVICDAGTYSTLGQGTCTSCPANTYAPESGTSECAACSGTVGNSGTTCDGATSDCGVGFELNPATGLCECAPGYGYSAPSTCTECAVNFFSAGGTDACAACAADTFSAAGSESCGVCPAGEAKNGSGVCARCAAGEEPATGSLSCQACASGFYNPDSSGSAQFDTCQRCDSGKYTPDKLSCTACAAGTYSIWSSSSTRVPSTATTCQACPNGGYSAAGASRCTPCAGGAEANGAGDGCQKCAAGTARFPYSAGGCVACVAGTYAKAGADTCVNCSPGTYSGASAGTCAACAEDTYSSDSGATTCTACPTGSSTLGETGSTECSSCPAGTKMVGNTCVDCPIGYYQNREGQNKCKKCSVGKFSDAEGSTSCDSCAAGKYQSVAGSSSCRVCPGGTFSGVGKGSCSICAKGKFSAPGATACKSCTAGYYANKLGSRICTRCPKGSKCPGSGRTSPALCSAGTFQAKQAQTTCTSCPRKTYAAKAGASKCDSCPTATTVGSTTCPASRRRMLFTRLADISQF